VFGVFGALLHATAFFFFDDVDGGQANEQKQARCKITL